jgi:AcrR family transcriptional regulator
MAMEQERLSGRQQEIIDAAFKLASVKNGWSMAEVALSIGVSKTALYRHFKNREEIERCMNERLLADLCAMIEAAESTPGGIRTSAVRFLRAHPGYVFLLLHNFFTRSDYPKNLFDRLRTDSSAAAWYFDTMESMPEDRRIKKEIAMVKNWVSVIIASFRADGKETIQDDLVRILGLGLTYLAQPDEKRFDELDGIAQIDPSELEGGNRLFEAIAASIREYGITKTTIETIARKMGTAKSSLYFYGRSKDSMLSDLMENETGIIEKLCFARVREGRTIAEQLYIVMMTQANYLILKPELIPVFSWIRYDSSRLDAKSEKELLDRKLEAIKAFRVDELFRETRSDAAIRTALTINWASVMSASCIIRGTERGLGAAELRKNVRLMFKCMMIGDKEY